MAEQKLRSSRRWRLLLLNRLVDEFCQSPTTSSWHVPAYASKVPSPFMISVLPLRSDMEIALLSDKSKKKGPLSLSCTTNWEFGYCLY